jgi:hypothetical protein
MVCLTVAPPSASQGVPLQTRPLPQEIVQAPQGRRHQGGDGCRHPSQGKFLSRVALNQIGRLELLELPIWFGIAMDGCLDQADKCN